ncbi:MAG: hydroxysqualene dehydroxylase HpnE [Zoogloeaceae bacterium]|jgi:squalene-associated FAD-dependent desaturase|nr:hydroxysqualene dehydroxylase HpnE [Zoogloeaceae bacterium]
MTRCRIAIIGGGWAGLAAAVELSPADGNCPAGGDLAITLFDAGRQPGGRARALPRTEGSGATLDHGQHLLLGAYRETLALMERVGVRPEAVLHRLPLEIRDPDGFRLTLPSSLPPPFHLAWGLLTARGVGFREKLRAALWMRHLQKHGFRLAEDVPVSRWLHAGQQRGRLSQRLWAPLCLAALNTPPELASAQVFANVLRDSLGSPLPGATDLLLPRVSLSEVFPDPAVRWLRARGVTIRTGCRVRALKRRADGGWRLIPANGNAEVFDAIILAVAPQHLAALLPPECAPPALDFEPIATLYLFYPGATALPCPLMTLTGGIGQWLVDRGNGVLAAIFSGHGDWENWTPKTLTETLHREIAAILPDSPPPATHRFLKEQRATFSCRPNLIRMAQHTPWPDLWIAGDHTASDYPATLEGAIRSGQNAARLCLGRRQGSAARDRIPYGYKPR